MRRYEVDTAPGYGRQVRGEMNAALCDRWGTSGWGGGGATPPFEIGAHRHDNKRTRGAVHKR